MCLAESYYKVVGKGSNYTKLLECSFTKCKYKLDQYLSIISVKSCRDRVTTTTSHRDLMVR